MVNVDTQLGVNVREFAYYASDVRNDLHSTPATLRLDQTNALVGMNGRLLRFYAFHTAKDPEQCIPFVANALDLLKEKGIKAIVCLDDELAESGFYIKGTGPYRVKDGEGVQGETGH